MPYTDTTVSNLVINVLTTSQYSSISSPSSSELYLITDDDGTLPAVTSSDNGKVLRVVNGAWAAVSLPSASGNSF